MKTPLLYLVIVGVASLSSACGGDPDAGPGPASALGTPESGGGEGGGASGSGGGGGGGGGARAAAGGAGGLDPRLAAALERCLTRTLVSAADPAIYYACFGLGPHLDRLRPLLATRCEGGDSSACFLLYSVDRRAFGWGFEVLLFSPPCRATERCLEWLTLASLSPFDGYERAQIHADADPAPLVRACEAGHADACLALARVPGQADHASSFFQRACELGRSAACVEVAHRLHMLRGAHGHAETQLRPACERGDLVACSNLGLMLERGLIGEPDADASGTLLRRACGEPIAVEEGESAPQRWLDLDEADRNRLAGCVNLVYFGENHRREARALRIDRSAARQVLALACEHGGYGGHACAAFARMRRQRGEPSTVALRRLACERGVQRECR